VGNVHEANCNGGATSSSFGIKHCDLLRQGIDHHAGPWLCKSGERNMRRIFNNDHTFSFPELTRHSEAYQNVVCVCLSDVNIVRIKTSGDAESLS
jgi:hypothetical protein